MEGRREGRIKGVIQEGERDCAEAEMEEERGGIAGERSKAGGWTGRRKRTVEGMEGGDGGIAREKTEEEITLRRRRSDGLLEGNRRRGITGGKKGI